MSLANYNREELQDISMIELAVMILEKEKKAVGYKELYQQIAEMKNFTEADKDLYIAQFYTDLNIDGRFLTLGSGMWGLKSWYPVEQIDEEITAAPKKKKKKATKKKKEKELPIEEIDEDITEDPLDFDDTDFLEDDLEDSEDEDLEDETLEDDFDDEDDFDEEDEDEDEDK